MSHPRDATSHQDWPDHLTVTRNSGVDFYYEQYRRLRDREESLLKERDSLRRENIALRSRLPGPTNTIVALATHIPRIIAHGRHTREIAQDLFLVIDTVRKHTSHILSKLDASGRTHEVERARQLGLFP